MIIQQTITYGGEINLVKLVIDLPFVGFKEVQGPFRPVPFDFHSMQSQGNAKNLNIYISWPLVPYKNVKSTQMLLPHRKIFNKYIFRCFEISIATKQYTKINGERV